ncbi:hypothetical protein HWV62_19623 [Athelia sp. TMB]|nr:hypothetical protein HWV62_19623 [Athelia sp. TMB]
MPVARALWHAAGLPPAALSALTFTPASGADPAVNSSFRLGTAAQTAIGVSALAAAHFHALRTGIEQGVAVDARHAILEFQSELFYTLDGQPPAGSMWDPLAGVYATADGFVRLHTNFPHHRAGLLALLQCPADADRATVQAALRPWRATAFEDAAAACGMVASALRTFEEWDAHPQAAALARQPPVTITKVGDAPRRAPTPGKRPLEGIRALDLSRVLAGPVCGRTLAAHGADVLLLTAPHLPALPLLDADTARGKRAAQLDLRTPAGRDTLAGLVEGADVFLQAYRPGGLAEKGFGVADVVRARPGIVYASLTAYVWEGPWKDRRGSRRQFDSLVQTATGFNHAEAEAFAVSQGQGGDVPLAPRALPMQALDHAAGYLLAFGISAALCRTITEGGSWEVRVSLAAVGQWLRALGRLGPDAFCVGRPMPRAGVPLDPEIAAVAVTLKEARGDGDNDVVNGRKTMTAVGHAAVLEKTPAREGEVPLALDTHGPVWLPRE